MHKSTSIADVAADAGVSATTVSHALSGNRWVSDETRKRVQESVDRLGYRPNLVARSLRLQKTHTVALLVVDITNPYYPAVARAATDVLSADGYLTFIGNTDGEATSERKFLEEAVARNVDGIIMQPMSLTFEEIRSIVRQMPLVIIGNTEVEPVADMISTIDADGIGEGVAHLARAGHTNIAFVSGPSDREPGPARLEAFLAASAAAGIVLSEANILHAAFTHPGGQLAGTTLFARAPEELPTAVMCANDLIAIGVMDAAHRAGLRIPEDVAVIGFDNIDTASLLSPQLTTVDSAASAVGTRSAEAIVRRIAAPDETPFRIVELSTRLVIRESA